MELAMHRALLVAERMFQKSFLPSLRKQVIPVSFTTHIVRVDSRDQAPGHDYSHENIYFTYSSMQGAIDQVQRAAVSLGCDPGAAGTGSGQCYPIEIVERNRQRKGHSLDLVYTEIQTNCQGPCPEHRSGRILLWRDYFVHPEKN